MAGVTLSAKGLDPIKVVKYPSRRDDQDDRWHVELGSYDAGGGARYPLASLYLAEDEARALVVALEDALPND